MAEEGKRLAERRIHRRGSKPGLTNQTRRMTIRDVYEMRDEYNSGKKTIKEIANMFGVPEHWVHSACQPHGVNLWKKRLKENRCRGCGARLAKNVNLKFCNGCTRARRDRSRKKQQKIQRFMGLSRDEFSDFNGGRVQKGALYFARALYSLAMGRSHSQSKTFDGRSCTDYDHFDELEKIFRRFFVYANAMSSRLERRLQFEADKIRLEALNMMLDIRKEGGDFVSE